MQLDQEITSSIPINKPQLHSRKCHHTYNGTRCLPQAVWIRSLRFGDPDALNQAHHHPLDLNRGDHCTLFYEILLYYQHNRACTIYRTPEDFRKLKGALGGGGGGHCNVHVVDTCNSSNSRDPVVEDVEDLQRFLCESIQKMGRSCIPLEYFLRRRVDDCGGV